MLFDIHMYIYMILKKYKRANNMRIVYLRELGNLIERADICIDVCNMYEIIVSVSK